MRDASHVVLVHGLWYGRPSLWPIQHQLQQRGYVTHSFGYSSVYRDPGENSARLAQWAMGLGQAELHWIGHSLGGLLLLRMLAEASGRLPPGRVVLLGCPIRGSAAARACARFLPFRWTLGKALPLLEQGYPCLPADRAVASVAGDSSLGLGQIFGSLPGEHDGTVAVEETRVDGLACHWTLPVNHTGMLWSSGVAEAVDDFLCASGVVPAPQSSP